MLEGFNNKEYWRLLILYGLNTSTYKLALAKCLYSLALKGKTNVSMGELSKEFFDIYKIRLDNGMPQLNHETRTTKMEQIVMRYNHDVVSYDEALGFVENNAFGDVIPRFHNINNKSINHKFYEITDAGIVLTDSLYGVFDDDEKSALLQEIDARWSLLESAFSMRKENAELINDIKKFYLLRGYGRTDITYMRDMLNGYQNGKCFYCGEQMDLEYVHVDHVIPRAYLFHDEPWNLVLSHEFCNENKSDFLPGEIYINKLVQRNECLIYSNHPLSKKIVAALGTTFKKRYDSTFAVYNQIKEAVKFTWDGIRGYNPEEDSLYKRLVNTI